jgi:hypothetical protein
MMHYIEQSSCFDGGIIGSDAGLRCPNYVSRCEFQFLEWRAILPCRYKIFALASVAPFIPEFVQWIAQTRSLKKAVNPSELTSEIFCTYACSCAKSRSRVLGSMAVATVLTMAQLKM